MLGWFRRFRLPLPPLVLFRVRRPSAFLFPCLSRVRPLWARFHVLVFSPSFFFCVPLFASWLSNFHLEGVCVNRLIRSKTSNLAGGAGGTDETGTNKDTHQLPVISMGTLIDVPASFFISIFCNGKWPTQKPPCRLEDHELVQMEQLHLART